MAVKNMDTIIFGKIKHHDDFEDNFQGCFQDRQDWDPVGKGAAWFPGCTECEDRFHQELRNRMREANWSPGYTNLQRFEDIVQADFQDWQNGNFDCRSSGIEELLDAPIARTASRTGLTRIKMSVATKYGTEDLEYHETKDTESTSYYNAEVLLLQL
ncbi:unnamed protein product [Caenorhabditis nigoni]